MSIPERVQNIFRDTFDDPSLVIGRQTSAKDIESWDSLAHVNLIIAVENEFNIKFALGEIGDFKNVGDMMDMIEKKLNAKK